VWRNFSDNRAGKRGHYVVVWRPGAWPSIPWSRSTPTMPRVPRKSAPTVTKKSRHTWP